MPALIAEPKPRVDAVRTSQSGDLARRIAETAKPVIERDPPADRDTLLRSVRQASAE
jgi:hypothetical protein